MASQMTTIRPGERRRLGLLRGTAAAAARATAPLTSSYSLGSYREGCCDPVGAS